MHPKGTHMLPRYMVPEHITCIFPPEMWLSFFHAGFCKYPEAFQIRNYSEGGQDTSGLAGTQVIMIQINWSPALPHTTLDEGKSNRQLIKT